MQFLDWFVKEQGEEEKNAEDLIKKMKLYGEDAKGLYMLNSEMAARVYTAPSRAWRPQFALRGAGPERVLLRAAFSGVQRLFLTALSYSSILA